MIAVTRALFLHPPTEPVARFADTLADADPAVTVVAATTVDDAEAALQSSSFDCVVNAFDPADDGGVELLRAVREAAPGLAQVLVSVDADTRDDGGTGTVALINRIVAAAAATTADEPSIPAAAVSTLIYAIPGFCSLVTADGGLVRWNERVAGIPDAEPTVGDDLSSLVAPEAADRLRRAIGDAAATGRSVVEAPVETTDGGADHEWTLTRLDDRLLVAVGLDVSERAAVAAELHETEASLAALYETLSNRGLSFEQRLDRVLELGCERLGVEYGFLTRISGNTQRIVDAHGSHPSLQPDEECPLSEAYCRKTIRGDGLLGIHDAVADGWEADSAYDAFGLDCYLGGKVFVDGDLYGTLCFADDEARTTAFTDAERTFVELLTRWMSYGLEERAARETPEQQNERLAEFANIVSHDIRSPLTVAKGQLQLAHETGDSSHLTGAESALERIEDLVTDLLNLARQGSVIESTDEVELGTAVADAWANVATDDADLIVESDGTIKADRDRLLRLLENLFRNAVEHGSTSPRSVAPEDAVEHDRTDGDALTITVGVLDRGFYVADTGPGIPPEERGSVFERGHSTNDGTGLASTSFRPSPKPTAGISASPRATRAAPASSSLALTAPSPPRRTGTFMMDTAVT